jgi:hypothetical protein
MKMPSIIARLLGLKLHDAASTPAPTHLHCPCCRANLEANQAVYLEDAVSVVPKPWRINVFVHGLTRQEAVAQLEHMTTEISLGHFAIVSGNGWMDVRYTRDMNRDFYHRTLKNELACRRVEAKIVEKLGEWTASGCKDPNTIATEMCKLYSQRESLKEEFRQLAAEMEQRDSPNNN